jgi:hypothetical protein
MNIEKLDNLFELSAGEIDEWLHLLEIGEQPYPTDFNWLGLAEMADTRMQTQTHAKNISESLEWAKVKISALRVLSDISFEISEMQTRAFLIGNFGARTGDSILDFSILNDWFCNSVTVSLDDVIQQAKDVRIALSNNDRAKLDIEKLRELRLLKNKIYVFKILKETDVLLNHSKINDFLGIFDLLP